MNLLEIVTGTPHGDWKNTLKLEEQGWYTSPVTRGNYYL
jgi:hypothetical protein